MFRHHLCWPLGLLLVIACAPPTPQSVVALEGVVGGTPVMLGELSAWDSVDDLLMAQLSLVPRKAVVTCTRDGAAVPCERALTGEDVVSLTWPRTKLGTEQSTFVVSLNGAEAGRWVVSRTITDPQLAVCTDGARGEDDTLPLDRCAALDPFGDLQLPLERVDAMVFKRTRFTVQSGRVELVRRGLASHGDEEPRLLALGFSVRNAEVTPQQPAIIELDSQGTLTAGGRSLSWRAPTARGLKVRDLDPAREPVRVRVGSHVEISRSIQAVGESSDLTDFRGEPGVLALTSSLPARLDTSAPIGLTVEISPTTVGARTLWPRLTLRSSSGDWTDRIPFRVEGLPASTCKLEASDLNLGAMLVGETRVARLQVRNTGTGSCGKLLVYALPAGLELESRPVPAPGESVEWRLTFSPREPGLQVVLLKVDFDDARPSFADLTLRVEAAVTR